MPKNVCSGQVGTRRVFRHFPGYDTEVERQAIADRGEIEMEEKVAK